MIPFRGICFFDGKMGIKNELLADEKQSRIAAMRIADHACSSQETFEELLKCFISGDYRLAQRAAHSLTFAAQKEPELIKPYIGILVKQLGRDDVHDAILRNSARILEDVIVPEEYHGELIDTVFKHVRNTQTAIAIRAFCLTILYNLTLIYPELKNELRYEIRERIDYEGPAFISRARKILARI
ncbi:hypothetical protein [Dyadobacter sp. CY343]|uniref:hypothetical protein n=1 Tax=Dyadobacter sp. CY343 TaxID=2907299 RepID=UPI001F166D91|nr:hypothetical protein [Dyadobacter sp. CY343]